MSNQAEIVQEDNVVIEEPAAVPDETTEPRRIRRAPRPFTPTVNIEMARKLVTRAAKNKNRRSSVQSPKKNEQQRKSPTLGHSKNNLDGYRIPKRKQQEHDQSSDESDGSESPPPSKKSKKETTGIQPEDLVSVLSSFKQVLFQELEGRMKDIKSKPEEAKPDRRWLQGIEHRDFKSEAVQQQIKFNDGLFRLVAEARDNAEAGGDQCTKNVDSCLEAAEKKINNRQKFLVAGQAYGFKLAENSFGEGVAQDFAPAELQHIIQQQLLLTKLENLKGPQKGRSTYGKARNDAGRMAQGNGEKESLCYNCGEIGHYARNCPKPKKDTQG